VGVLFDHRFPEDRLLGTEVDDGQAALASHVMDGIRGVACVGRAAEDNRLVPQPAIHGQIGIHVDTVTLVVDTHHFPCAVPARKGALEAGGFQ